MCGILGSINISNVNEVLPLIRHRGPDASGEKNYTVDQHAVSLLHQRLSIVDLSEAGSQPMVTSNTTGCIIFNGEIYNHMVLKQKLHDIPFKGHSDTETIVEYFNMFGIEKTISDLNGIFAIGYLDTKAKKLHLARDRFGVKPLYYYYKDNQLIFSSEIRPLKAVLSPTIDSNTALLGLQLRYIPSPFTLYHNIKKVEPGQLLTFDLSNAEIKTEKKYFPVISKRIGGKRREFISLVNEYGSAFEKAVERQMMADVEVGVLLSGGIDSALVAAVARDKTAKKLKAFTVGFTGDYSAIDEIALAKETANLLGLDHYEKKIDFEDFLKSLKQVVDIVEEPIATTSIIPMFSLAQLASSKVKVVLSGQGADEPLGGYEKYKGLLWMESLRKIQSIIPSSRLLEIISWSNERMRRMVDAVKSDSTVESYINFNSIFSHTEMAHLLNHASEKNFLVKNTISIEAFEKILAAKKPLYTSLKDLFLYYDVRTSLSDDLLMYTDKITMNFGLECRVPILDNELIQFIESLDSHYKFSFRKGKIIHKEFAREYLPSALIERKKLDFQSPTAEWFRLHIKEIESIFFDEKTNTGFFNIDSVKKILAAHKKGQNMEKQIFLLLSLSKILTAN